MRVSLKPPEYPNITPSEIIPSLETIYSERAVDRYYFNGATEFEKELCSYLDVKHCFVTSSGHASIFIALLAAGVKAGDEVITTPISWGQTLSPILHVGAKPIFADIDSKTFQISYDNILKKYNDRTKAVLVVNLYGASPELLKIKKFCEEKNIKLIEDSAQSMGLKYNNRYTGTIGDIGAFSFNSTKLLPIGGSGAVVTNDDDLFEKIILYGSKSTHKKKALKNTEYILDGLDFTFLCHPILQEMGRVKLNQLDEMNYYRSENMKFLRTELEDVKGIQLQELNEGSSQPCYMFSFKNLLPIKLNKLFDLFKYCNLPIFSYNPTPLSDIKTDRFTWAPKYEKQDCPEAKDLSSNEVCITSYKWFTEDRDYLKEYSDCIHYCYEQLERKL